MEVCKKDGNGITSKIVGGIKKIFKKNNYSKDINNATQVKAAKTQTIKQESTQDSRSNNFNERIKVDNTNIEKNAMDNMDKKANSQQSEMTIDDPDEVQV